MATTIADPSHQYRVSFREDVKLPQPELATTGTMDGLSARSALSSHSSDDGSHPSSNTKKYSKLRSSLTREQTNRDPLVFYQVTRHLGSGSMGDVKLVKKRHIGGSARKNVQQAVQRHQQATKCLNTPVIGNLFQFCVDGRLVVGKADPSDSRHSIGSYFGKKEDITVSTTTEESNDSSSTGSTDVIIYAMKSIHLSQLTNPQIVDELRNEVAILKSLDHPNIVRAMETFEYKGKISIVMELCAGGDLYSQDPYKEPEAARILTSILSALVHMHSRNIVHRDLKFENVLFVTASPLSDVKLIDFGLSKVYVDTKLTEVSGTIYTMAPEVLLGQHTTKADMWSVGVIAFMLLASALPFYGKDRLETVKRILNGKFAFRGKRWKRVSPAAIEFINDLLVSNPDDRFDAETALGSAWLAQQQSPSLLLAEEEDMARASMQRYATYPKLKKMALMVVAHKSSSEEIGILRKLFQKYDTRHDGSIAFEDFVQANNGSGYSQEELRVIFDAMDLAGSGKVRYTEFIAATIETHGALSEARLAEAFDRLDSDDSGYIEAENLIEILGQDVPREEIDSIIAEADLTKDNRVSYSEFLALWENQEDLGADGNVKVLENELSSLSMDESVCSTAEETAARGAFLKEKHLQNTLHTWSLEMQLPAHEFARGCSVLHQVALGNQAALEKILEDRPALVNFRDYDRRTALHIAASEGHVGICQFLIKKGARVNRSDRWGGFPLDDAHRHGHSDIVNLLREHGAKFGSTSQTVNLIVAASKGNVEEVKTLLEFGSMDLNQGDYDHRTALHLAANEGHVEVVRLLCEAGADINVKDRWGDRPLDDARKAKKNANSIVNILSGRGNPALSKDEQGARMRDLKDQSAKQTTIPRPDEGKDEGMTPLPVQEFAMGCSVLHQAALGYQLVLEKIFQQHPGLVNFRDYDRRTALHIAASEGQLDICKYLVAKGARINRCDRWGGSPLDDAHRHRHGDVVKFLREQGAKFGSTSQVTNFITAASEGDTEEVAAFLEFGSVDINEGDYDRRTALHLAVNEGQLEIVKMLCDAGANVNVEDRWGHRPLDDAKKAKSNSAEIMKLLLHHGAKSFKISTLVAIAFLRVTTLSNSSTGKLGFSNCIHV